MAGCIAPDATLEGLLSLTDMKVGSMSEISVKQMLMDLRELGLVTLGNEQIAGLGLYDARGKLMDAKRAAEKR